MKKVRLTQAAMGVLHKHSLTGHLDLSHCTRDGDDWLVSLSQDVLSAIEERTFPGETISDVIVRLASTQN